MGTAPPVGALASVWLTPCQVQGLDQEEPRRSRVSDPIFQGHRGLRLLATQYVRTGGVAPGPAVWWPRPGAGGSSLASRARGVFTLVENHSHLKKPCFARAGGVHESIIADITRQPCFARAGGVPWSRGAFNLALPYFFFLTTTFSLFLKAPRRLHRWSLQGVFGAYNGVSGVSTPSGEGGRVGVVAWARSSPRRGPSPSSCAPLGGPSP